MDFSQIVDRLVYQEHGPRASILLQVDPTGLDIARTRIAARDALTLARDELSTIAGGEHVVAGVRVLEQHIRDPRFWRDRHLPGFGMFLAPGLEMTVDLPASPEEATSVGLVFRLLEAFAAVNERRCVVLAVSDNAARLFEVSRNGAVERRVAGMPKGLDEVAQYTEIEVSLQFHATARGGANVFHGHEPGVRTLDDLRERYLREIDRTLLDLRGISDLPVVLAGVEEIVAGYRNISHLPHLMSRSIPGSHDRTSPAEIARLTQELVGHDDLNPVRERDRSAVAAGGRRSLTEPRAVFHAAEEGRVEAVFLSLDRGGNGLVFDEVAAAVHRKGGRVWIDDQPAYDAGVGALLRF
jgi:hypothetical protein